MIIRYDTSKCTYHQLVNFAVESARLRNIEKLFIVLNKYLRISRLFVMRALIFVINKWRVNEDKKFLPTKYNQEKNVSFANVNLFCVK
ncbi:hypothetical protein T03_621 [Trichinella britovi]|uniref:Uncharacterized protein n=1 Tax=Trichinella britovi TaxID=45882 RepID=A0A0V1D6M4_TRIBR|nr:hypothetical protein T03_621 [Trichinella britovi]